LPELVSDLNHIVRDGFASAPGRSRVRREAVRMTEETAEQRLRRIARANRSAERPVDEGEGRGGPRRREERYEGERYEGGRYVGDGEDADDLDDDLDDDLEEPRQSFLQNVWGGIKEILIIAVMALVLSFVVKTWLIQAFYIPSGSMEDTLVRDDRVIVSKLTPGPFDLQRGDVVVFKDPGNWLGSEPEVVDTGSRATLHRAMQFIGLLPDDSDDHLIKRVIGLPGDHVVCCDKDAHLTVNGVGVTEPYVKPGDAAGGGKANFDITVPAGSVWVMGDHRSDSSDSRFHDDGTGAKGSVPIDDITGRAVMIVWPVDHVRWLSVPERVYADIPAPSGTAPASSPTGATG
jgi:signal peptidase I